MIMFAGNNNFAATASYCMDKKLGGQNISGLLEYLQSKPCVSWTRSHVAEFLVADGRCKDMQRAFKRFLGPGGSAFVAAQWPEMDEAIAAIQQASGIAVLAHAAAGSPGEAR